MAIKRINLYFDMNRNDDKKTYDILMQKKHKTEYIIKLILESDTLCEDTIRKIFKEVLKEQGIKKIEKEVNTEEKVPEEFFDLFSQM